jgi:hypothetical protein
VSWEPVFALLLSTLVGQLALLLSTLVGQHIKAALLDEGPVGIEFMRRLRKGEAILEKTDPLSDFDLSLVRRNSI